MEDTVVCKGLFAYQFRVDLSGCPQSTAEIRKFLDKFGFVKYLGEFEFGDKTKKPHYQMCIWRESPFATSSEQTKARNYWRGKTCKTKQPVSLTSAKKIKNLCAYCQKDEFEVIKVEKQPKMTDYFQHLNNLSKEERMAIPKWQSVKGLKLKKREIFNSTVKSVIHTSQNLDKFGFLCAINNVYFQVYERPCLHKGTYIKLLYQYGYVDDKDIVSHVFPFALP